MWNKIQEIRKAHPIPFWIAVTVVFPLGLTLLFVFLFSGRAPQDRDLLDEAASEKGKSEVHEENADAQQREIDEGLQQAAQERKKLLDRLARLKRKADHYKKKKEDIQKADSWEDVDREAGVK